jgi:cyclic pyranopterin phosphate synthase
VGWDVLGRLRSGADQDALVAMIAGVWGKRTDRYSDERAERGTDPNAPGKPEMSYLGG